MRRGALAAPSWPRSVGSTDARLWGLAGRQAGSCLHRYGDKSIKKKEKSTKGLFSQEEGSHLPLGTAGPRWHREAVLLLE